MQFVFQALTWGFLIALVPLLIHLINMLRHRRIKWAAMDFLLQSYKKHRRWVWLKQLLLLLMRMAAIALIVAMLAQWDPRGSWLQSLGLGGKTTHHYVLLDDSYSMSERKGAGGVFDTALQAVARIGAEASQQKSPQRFTLIRFSRAALPPTLDATAADIADLNNEVVDAEFATRLEETTRKLEASQLAAGPRAALQVLNQLLQEGRNEKNVAYVISDFRVRPWETPAEARDVMQEIEQKSDKIHLVSAARQSQANLSIEDVRPDGSTRAAGVPLFIDVIVRNHSDSAVSKVEVKARTVTYDPDEESDGKPGELSGAAEELSAEVIETIPAGGSAAARFQVAFSTVGRHVFQAELPEDTVSADNRRWTVLPLESGEPVLAIEDRQEHLNGDFLLKILQPGGQANTGLRPVLQTSSYLRDAAQEDLRRYSSVYLLGASQLDAQMVDNLEEYVAAGGGLAIFMGPGVELDLYNQMLYKDGAGLMPIPLGRRWLLAPPLDEAAPDIDITGTNHDVFRDLLRGRNPIIRMVQVSQYVEPPATWRIGADKSVDVLARLHNSMPLAAEKRFGNGRVFQFMSSYAPTWNDLALGPNVLMTLNLQAYLASTRRISDDRLVGSQLLAEFNGEEFERNVDFVVPGAKSPIVVQRPAESAGPDSQLLEARLATQTERSGVYEAWLEDLDGRFSVRRYGLNVDPSEGDLRLVDSQAMLTSLEPVKPTFQYAEDVYGIVDEGGFNPSLWIMGLLIVLLLGEQMLAYILSYHSASQGDAR